MLLVVYVSEFDMLQWMANTVCWVFLAFLEIPVKFAEKQRN